MPKFSRIMRQVKKRNSKIRLNLRTVLNKNLRRNIRKYISIKRVKKHNNGQGAKFPFSTSCKLVYYELLKNKSAALKRENALKKNRILRNQIKKKYKNIDILNDK